jgi:hypothetical protein
MSEVRLIPYEEWIELPAATQDMLKAIGFPVPKPGHIHKAKTEPLHPAEKQRRQERRDTCPEPYQLLLTTYCLTCNVSSLDVIHMAKNSTGECLVRIPINGPLPNLKVKKHSVETYSCKSCMVVLMEKPKDVLVKMILSLNDSLKYRWPEERPEDFMP